MTTMKYAKAILGSIAVFMVLAGDVLNYGTGAVVRIRVADCRFAPREERMTTLTEKPKSSKKAQNEIWNA